MPEITEVFYPHQRADWRKWLQEHHQTKTEIWLRMFRKDTGKPSLSMMTAKGKQYGTQPLVGIMDDISPIVSKDG